MRTLPRVASVALLVFSLCPANRARASVDGLWYELSPPPAAEAAAYIPARHQLITFTPHVGGAGLDVLLLSLNGTWQVLPALGTPPADPYDSPACIYDPIRDRIVLFGVGNGGPAGSNGVWAVDLSGTPTWTQLFPTGGPPGTRSGGTSAMYDPVRDRMIVCGGHVSAGSGDFWYSETWALSLSGTPAWTQLASAPTGRAFHSAVYDPARDRMLVYGGEYNYAVLNDVVAFDCAAGRWSTVSTAGGPPEPRESHGATYDPVRDRMVVAGGTNGQSMPHTWALTLAGTPTWVALNPTDDPLSVMAGGYDGASDAVLAFDGYALSSLPLAGPPAWTRANPTGPVPIVDIASGVSQPLIHDSLRDRWLALWASREPGSAPGVWALSFAGGQPVWTPIAATGTPPPARMGYAAAYDAVADRVVLFGGGNSPPGTVYRNDVWTLSLSGDPTWSQLTPSGTGPAPCQGTAGVFDAARDRMIIWGGFFDGGGQFDSTTWALDLSGNGAWSVLPGAGPPGRFFHSAVLDSGHGRMLIYGGRHYDATRFNDTWALPLSGGSWQSIGGTGAPPPTNYPPDALGYDPARDRMVVLGSYGGNQPWALDLATYAWSQLASSGVAPRSRFEFGAFDATRHQMLFYANDGYSKYELAALTFADGALAVDDSRESGLTIRATTPSGVVVRLALTLPTGAPARLELVDVAGRRLASNRIVNIGPGAHTMSFATPAGLRPGLYWLRLTQSGRAASTRVALLR